MYMKIWITRHGQTNLNKKHLMQGRTNEPLNDTGRMQAKEARKRHPLLVMFQKNK